MEHLVNNFKAQIPPKDLELAWYCVVRNGGAGDELLSNLPKLSDEQNKYLLSHTLVSEKIDTKTINRLLEYGIKSLRQLSEYEQIELCLQVIDHYDTKLLKKLLDDGIVKKEALNQNIDHKYPILHLCKITRGNTNIYR